MFRDPSSNAECWEDTCVLCSLFPHARMFEYLSCETSDPSPATRHIFFIYVYLFIAHELYKIYITVHTTLSL